MFGGQIRGVLYSLRWLLILDPSGLEENKTFSTGVLGVGRHDTTHVSLPFTFFMP